MRIRRRPQHSPQLGSDPTTSTAPQTPQNAARSRGWLYPGGGGDGDGGDREAGKLLHAGADLAHKSGVSRRLALPQEDNVVVDCGRSSMGAQHELGGGHRRFSAVSNGHHILDWKDGVACGVGGKSESAAAKAVEERLTSNGGAPQLASVPVAVAAVAVKDEGKAGSNGSSCGGAKKRRGPAVLLEGSRCSRVNGRGWRCSQPTLVGYSLCEHHLGKGRMRSAAAAARGRLGRTENIARTIPAAVTVAAAAAAPPKAEAPSLPPC